MPAVTKPASVGQGVTHLTVTERNAGQRLDNYLFAQYRTLPRTLVYRWLRTGAVRVNRKRAQAVTRLAAGDEVRVPPVHDLAPRREPARPSATLAQALHQRVIHEDATVLVVDKPSGLASHGGSGLSLGLIEALRALRPDLRELELVHRLDRDTSGCLVLARRRSALRALHAALREGAFAKHYLALLCGRLPARRVVDLALAPALRGGQRVMKPDPAGQAAHTVFEPVEGLGAYTLVRVELGTGRMHQIRAHAAAIGLPVAGDDRYGEGVPPPGLRRLFLHAHVLGFPAPDGSGPLRFSAPLPDELEEVLGTLRDRSVAGAPV